MTNNIKLLALDIDGTLLGRDYIISDQVKAAIKSVIAQTDVKVVLASGRMAHSTNVVAEELGVTTPMVCYQGAMVIQYPEKDILFHKQVPTNLAKKVIKEIEAEDIHVNIYINDQIYMTKITEVATSYSSARYLTPNLVKDYSILDNNPTTKIVGLDTNPDKVARLIDRLQPKYVNSLNITSSNPEFIEVVNPDVNKGKTLYEFAEKLWGIMPENIMAIGDGNNDFDMINQAGVGVAMGNATDKVKAAAKFITDTVDNYGAVKAIEKYLL